MAEQIPWSEDSRFAPMMENKPLPAPRETADDRMDKLIQKQASFQSGIGVEDSMAGFLSNQRTLGRISDEEMQKIDAINEAMGKGAAIAPFTLAPDMIGMAFDILNWGGKKAEQYMGLDRGTVFGQYPEFNGDPLRDVIGLDPEDVNGMIGEMFGNWENAVAKGGALGVKAFNLMMASPGGPETIFSTFLGARGFNRLKFATGDSKYNQTRAVEMMMQGEHPSEIFKETNFWFDPDEKKWKFFLNPAETKVDLTKVKRKLDRAKPHMEVGDTFKLEVTVGDYLDDPLLFSAYPELKDVKLYIPYKKTENGWVMYDKDKLATATKGGFNPDQNRISVYQSTDKDLGKGTLIHEVNHWIQEYEGFAKGHSLDWLEKQADSWMEVQEFDRFLKMRKEGTLPQLADDAQIRDAVTQYLQKYPPVGSAAAEMNNVVAVLTDLARNASNVRDAHIDESLEMSEHIVNKYRDDAILFLSTKAGDKDELLKAMEKFPDLDTLYNMAYQRYRYAGGEVNARIAQYFANKQKEEVEMILQGADPNRLKHLVGVPEGQRTLPGIEQKDTRVSVQDTSNLVTLDKPRIRSIQKKISKLEDLQQAQGENPYTELYKQAAIVLEDPELRPLMSTDTIKELQELFSKDKADVKAAVDYYQEMIDDLEDSLRFHLEKDPTVPNEDIDDIIEGIKDLNDPSTLSVQERGPSDPQANWHAGQDSGRGGVDWGAANDVPNESTLVGASELPEGTDRILSETEMKLLQNVIDNDPALLKRLLQGISE